MKKLLSKTLGAFTMYALIVLTASIPAYFFLVDTIWLRELDENNQIIAQKVEAQLNRLNLNEKELTQSIELWNKIQPGTSLRRLPTGVILPDSVYTVLRTNMYSTTLSSDRFRGLIKVVKINESFFELTVETNVEETEETAIAIAITTFFSFLVLVIGFLFLNRKISVTVWQPFRSTLTRLKAFKLSEQNSIEFEQSNIAEFEEMNIVLKKLLQHTISVYQSQKEFTENASHELQTPLAIIKNKLDILLQKETLTNRQYKIIEEASIAVTRISRINKNLLLLSKIENKQFNNNETFEADQLIMYSINELKEHFENKNIKLTTSITNKVEISANKILFEILINNLFINSIRHNLKNGEVYIFLDNNQVVVSNSGNDSLDNSIIFNRFSNPSGKKQGNGLGLAIVKEICFTHNWTINYNFINQRHIFCVRFNPTTK